jgi:uncharacterized protein (DUF1330 family)
LNQRLLRCGEAHCHAQGGPPATRSDTGIGIVDSEPQDHYAYRAHKLPQEMKRGSMMSAYFVVQATIKDEPQYQRYRGAVVPLIARFGGKFAARGAKVEVLEGEHDTRSVVMFEFPSMEAIHAFWNSPDYVPVKKMREGTATINV